MRIKELEERLKAILSLDWSSMEFDSEYGEFWIWAKKRGKTTSQEGRGKTLAEAIESFEKATK